MHIVIDETIKKYNILIKCPKVLSHVMQSSYLDSCSVLVIYPNIEVKFALFCIYFHCFLLVIFQNAMFTPISCIFRRLIYSKLSTGSECRILEFVRQI